MMKINFDWGEKLMGENLYVKYIIMNFSTMEKCGIYMRANIQYVIKKNIYIYITYNNIYILYNFINF